VTAVDLAALIVTLVCLAVVALLAFAVVSLVRTLRELRAVVADLRRTALPMVEDLRGTLSRADDELHRVDGVLSRAERISAAADHASRIAYRAFAPPLIKGVALASGAGQATRRLRARLRSRRSLDIAPGSATRGPRRPPARRSRRRRVARTARSSNARSRPR